MWSAGYSTGEEAYSLAILFSEVMEETGIVRDVKIFATDVDTRAIEQAGKGVFTESILEDVSPERLSRYFTKKERAVYRIEGNPADDYFLLLTICCQILRSEDWI